MILKRLRMQNIRSYIDESVSFSTGVTLLSGDIGSGKSTVLLGVEFALFGARRGDLSADSLLRYGCSSGGVELVFVLGEQEIVVSRSLKRTGSGVRQESGVLEVNGSSEELTATELRARVFELLGYPQELVSKASDVLFRYTVYTPQEEMKRILTDSSSHRLDVLRSIFSIDAYKTVLENVSSLVRGVREEQRFLEGSIADLQAHKDELSTLHARLSAAQEEVRKQLVVVEEAKEAVLVAEKSFAALRVSYESFRDYQQSLTRFVESRKRLLAEQERLLAEQARLEKQLSEKLSVVSDPSEKLVVVSDKLEQNQSVLAQARGSARLLQEQLRKLEEDARSVSRLASCPTCKQEVGSEYKEHVKQHAFEASEELREELATVQSRIEKASGNVDKLSRMRSQLREQERSFVSYQRVLSSRKLAREQLVRLQESLVSAQKELSSLQQPVVVEFDKAAYEKQEEVLTSARKTLSEQESVLATAKSSVAFVQERVISVKKVIAKKTSKQQRLFSLRSQEAWLKEVFSAAVSEVERVVFARLHQEFSAQFSVYVYELLEESGVFASLDESFSPLVTQDGFDAAVDSLSGGERQSLSLAYRLSLFRTINRFVDGVRTTGLLVLDEPTDGFSRQQLTRVQEVLTRLSCEQLIIVSHEPDMAGFADAVLSVVKREGVSSVS
ncbi:MAG: AAA family ATPase [Candidatus Woesearchaeota archaeon]